MMPSTLHKLTRLLRFTMAMAAISNFFVAIFTNSAAIWTYPPFDRCSTAYTNSDTFQLVSGGGLTNYPQIGPHGWILWSLLAWLYRISFAFSWGSDVTMYHVLFTFFVWLGFDRSHRPWHVKYLATTTCFWLYCGTVRSTAAFHLEEQVSTIHCENISFPALNCPKQC